MAACSSAADDAPAKLFHIMDARPILNAVANMAGGKGYFILGLGLIWTRLTTPFTAFAPHVVLCRALVHGSPLPMPPLPPTDPTQLTAC